MIASMHGNLCKGRVGRLGGAVGLLAVSDHGHVVSAANIAE